MKILLDIDGVMVPASSWKVTERLDDGFASFSPKSVSNLRKIVSETGATVVLTTSHKSNYTVKEWQAIFTNRGIDVSIEKLDENCNHLSRKEEILHWLKKGISDHFVIIDDDKSLNDLPAGVKDRLVLTSSLVGLNENDALTAIEILRMQESVFV